MGPKFVPNRSISNRFRNKQYFPFPLKFKMAAKFLEIQQFSDALYPRPLESQNLLALSLTVFKINNIFDGG